MKALPAFMACFVAALMGLSGCFWAAGTPTATVPGGSSPQVSQLVGTEPLQGIADFAPRQSQAAIGDVANGATVSLIEVSTGNTIATTLTSPSGVFSFSFGRFRPTPDVPYFLEAVKGLYTNRPSYDAVRLRTILVYNAGWRSISSGSPNGLVVISPETTALCIISAYRSTAVSAASLIGSLTPGIADTSVNPPTTSTFAPAGTQITNEEFHTVAGLVTQAMTQDTDPFFRVRYNPAFQTYSLSSEVITGGGSGGGTPSPSPSGAPAPTYGPNSPQIQGLSTYVGGPGTQVVLTGINFGPNVADNTASFAGTAATVVAAAGGTSLTLIVPEGANSGLLTVTTSLGTSNGIIFTIFASIYATYNPLRSPTITGVTPPAALPGATVSITGSNFDPSAGADWIVMNGQLASASAASTSSLTFRIPAGWTSGYMQVVKGTGPSNTQYLAVGRPVVVGSDRPSVVPGGTLRLSGNNFVPTLAGNTVNFVGGAGTIATASPTEITVTVPAGAQPGPVTVQTAAGTSDPFTLGILSGAQGTLQLATPPTATGMSPLRGPVGLGVTLTGSGFSTWLPGNVVRFNGVAATVTAASATSLSVIVPEGATTGPVTVDTAAGRAVVGTYTVYGPAVTSPAVSGPPQLSALVPTTALVGATVVLSGSNFDPIFANNQVSFNGTTATPTDGTSETLTVTVPVGATSGNVTVTHSGGTSTAQVFYVIPPNSGTLALTNPPTVNAVTPGNARLGETVTIGGTNFWPVSSANAVRFNGVSATVTAATATSLTCTVPAGATTGPLVVSTPSGRATWGTFTVNPEPPAPIVLVGGPTLTELSPPSSPAGTILTIRGSNFHPTFNQNTVTFNGATGTPTGGTTTALTVVVPAGATSGNVTVTTSGGASNGLPFVRIFDVGGTFDPQ